jgi:hypothetical protein
MEAQTALVEARDLDTREDTARGRARTFLNGALDALRAEEAIDALGDQQRDRALELVNELSGILDSRRKSIEVAS